jgi:hypothetical protein
MPQIGVVTLYACDAKWCTGDGIQQQRSSRVATLRVIKASKGCRFVFKHQRLDEEQV